MSIYLINNSITVTWVLGPTDNVIPEAEYDIQIITSGLEGSYTDGGIINYVAPTSITAGSIQYVFTPLAPGKYQLVLSTGEGNGYSELDKKDFWLFEEVPVSFTSTKILGALSRPQAKLFPTETQEWTSPNWYTISGITQHPTDTDMLYIFGREGFGDSLSTLQIYNFRTGAFTNYKTVPFNDPNSIAVTPSGRVYVLQGESPYACYWADAPYSSWTAATGSAPGGGGDINYDPVLDRMWWGTTTKMLVAAADATVFSYQNFELAPPGGSQFNCGNSVYWVRKEIAGTNFALWSGDVPISPSASERIYMNSQGAGAALPLTYTDVPEILDIYGSGGPYSAQVPKGSALTPDGSKWFVTGSGMILNSTLDGITWGEDFVDLATISGLTTFGYMFGVPAFNKMLVVGTNGATFEWWESSDGLTWAQSTDIRFTTYNVRGDTGGLGTPEVFVELADGGIAWIHETTPGSSYKVVHTI